MGTTHLLTVRVSRVCVCVSGVHTPPDPEADTPSLEPEADAPPVNRMTDTCKNITSPQTSFASSNNRFSQGLSLIYYLPIPNKVMILAKQINLFSYVVVGWHHSWDLWLLWMEYSHHVFPLAGDAEFTSYINLQGIPMGVFRVCHSGEHTLV